MKDFKSILYQSVYSKNIFLLVTVVFIFIGLSTLAENTEPKNEGASPDIVVHLLDYLAQDYAGAVQGGKIISQGEYDEQVEFIAIVEKNAQGSEGLKDQGFLKEVLKLSELIHNKADDQEVSSLARKLQKDAIRLAQINVSPTGLPDIALGAKIYSQSCVTCHGHNGFGDGPAGKGLDPEPANFHNPDLVQDSSPYKFYNTIRLGVPGTAMLAYEGLSDHEVWSLAFYLKSLPYEGAQTITSNKLSLAELSDLTDKEILSSIGGDPEEAQKVLAFLRSRLDSVEHKNPLRVAEDYLEQSVEAARKGDYKNAHSLAVKGYLEGIEPMEPKIRANLPGAVENIESLMADFRGALRANAPINEIKTKQIEIVGSLKNVKTNLNESKMSTSVAFGAALSILLREGFEAILIIIVLISVLKAAKQPQAIKWVHVGWVLALFVGIVAWFASGLLLKLSGLSREMMEGLISLFAVAVLIYVGFWLHRYSNIGKWRAFLEKKLNHGLSKKSYWALALVSFFAVFREAFEVVLFLRAIWIDLDPSGQSFVGFGVLFSFIILMGISYFAIKKSKKIPLEQLFKICSWTMVALAIVLAGKGLHALQEAGMVPVKIFAVPFRIDILGIYPNFQTLMIQAVVIVVFALLFWGERKKTIAN